MKIMKQELPLIEVEELSAEDILRLLDPGSPEADTQGHENLRQILQAQPWCQTLLAERKVV